MSVENYYRSCSKAHRGLVVTSLALITMVMASRTLTVLDRTYAALYDVHADISGIATSNAIGEGLPVYVKERLLEWQRQTIEQKLHETVNRNGGPKALELDDDFSDRCNVPLVYDESTLRAFGADAKGALIEDLVGDTRNHSSISLAMPQWDIVRDELLGNVTRRVRGVDANRNKEGGWDLAVTIEDGTAKSGLLVTETVWLAPYQKIVHVPSELYGYRVTDALEGRGLSDMTTWKFVRGLNLDDALRAVAERIQGTPRDAIAVGITVLADQGAWFGPLILLAWEIMILMNVSQIPKPFRTELRSDYGLLVAYPGILAEVVSYATLVLLPVVAAVLCIWPMSVAPPPPVAPGFELLPYALSTEPSIETSLFSQASGIVLAALMTTAAIRLIGLRVDVLGAQSPLTAWLRNGTVRRVELGDRTAW